MELLDELLPGCWLIAPKLFEDARGRFVKTVQETFFNAHGLTFKMREEFYSSSRAGVLRGMHFQCPPHDHIKLLSCLVGEVLDVLVDLRPGPGYGRSTSVQLSAENAYSIYIPSGIAHGFLAVSDGSLMVYKTSAEHMPSHDDGVRWDSFGFDWGIADPIVSDRDQSLPAFSIIQTPFAVS
jgi:dTDP-4-dehydrorhamnose 3,5-epimerase/CDP-3, 6-dideoxy-D-glycero-D-glycero-4-hexulose-5-epimerase